MLQHINYTTHLLLNSKYKLIVNIAFYLLIYLVIINNQIAYCMTEDNSIPLIAESKDVIRPSEQIIAIRRNIQAYAHTIASQMEERDQIIADSKQEIANLNLLTERQQDELSGLRKERTTTRNEINTQNTNLRVKDREIDDLKRSIEGGYIYGNHRIEGYKEKITKLEKQITELRRDLHITNTLLAEAKTDKDRLYSLVGEALKKR